MSTAHAFNCRTYAQLRNTVSEVYVKDGGSAFFVRWPPSGDCLAFCSMLAGSPHTSVQSSCWASCQQALEEAPAVCVPQPDFRKGFLFQFVFSSEVGRSASQSVPPHTEELSGIPGNSVACLVWLTRASL